MILKYLLPLAVFTERELVLELERLRTKNGKNKRDRSPSKLDSYVKTLEEERDYFKGEVEVLNKIMKNKALANTSTPSSPSRSRTSSPSRSSSKTKVLDVGFNIRCRIVFIASFQKKMHYTMPLNESKRYKPALGFNS